MIIALEVLACFAVVWTSFFVVGPLLIAAGVRTTRALFDLFDINL